MTEVEPNNKESQDTEQEEKEIPDNKNDDTQTKQQRKLPLPLKYYVKLEDLLQFLYPEHILHPSSTLRLFLFAEYGPLYNHHSYHQCLCAQCQQKCKQIRKENDIAKQLFLGKILIGTKELNQSDASLDWLCKKCKKHCSTVHHLKSGAKNLHIVSDSELSKMEKEIKRQDLLSCFVSKKEQLVNPLTAEEEEELIQRQPKRVKHLPKLSKQQIIEIFSKLPTYKVYSSDTATNTESNESEEKTEQIEKDEQENEDNVDTKQTAPETVEDVAKTEENTEENVTAAEQEEVNTNDDDTAVSAVDNEEEEEQDEVLSFYDISAVVRKVRERRKESLFRRSVTTQDPVLNGPKNRSKALRTRAVSYTKNKKQKFPDCQQSDVLTTLLHTFTHEIAALNTASASDITQNVRLLRSLQKDNDTNWDSNCCFRKSN